MAVEFASIPEPTDDPSSLLETVQALKQCVEALVGRRGTDASTAVTQEDLANNANLAFADKPQTRKNLGLGTAAEAVATLGLSDSSTLPSSTWFQVANNLSEGTAATKRSNLGVSYGKQSFWVPANAWELGTAARGTYTDGNGHAWPTLDFDQSVDETVYFSVALPKNWDKGAITFYVYWTANSGSGTVNWNIQAGLVSNDDALANTYTTGSALTDTLLATNDLHISPESGSLSAWTGVDHDILKMFLFRDVSEDTLNADARMIGVKFIYNTVLHTDD